MKRIASLLLLLLCPLVVWSQSPQPISQFLDRIGGAGASRMIDTQLDSTLALDGQERFVVSAHEGKPYIQGSSLSAITTGIGWYLNHTAHINIGWSNLSTTFHSLPLPVGEELHVCRADYRYYLNYCTFGYSMTTWTWERWQQEIDWMALHGINMPLQIVGMEKVWRDFLILDYGYTEDEAEDFVAGPAYIAWWGMNNLEGWGGTHDDAWFERQARLGRMICERERELGMQPVLPGFSGMVPSNFQQKTGLPTEKANLWCQFQRPAILDPTSDVFAQAAAKYYTRLADVLGHSRYYSMDPFHEGGTISSGRYAEGYKAVFDAMDASCGNDTRWVIQQWQWAPYQAQSLTAVPAGRLIVLDLFADGQPAFDAYRGYVPQEGVFCTIPNFGGRSGFMGRLANMAHNYFTYAAKYPSLKGVGAAPEAIESVPVVYDLLFELPWMDAEPDLSQWIDDYASARYGRLDHQAQSAWHDALQSALAFGADAIQGPLEDVWAARPNLDAAPASTWGRTIGQAASVYTRERRQCLIKAFCTLQGRQRQLKGGNYDFDLIEMGSQVMADYAYELMLGIRLARDAGDQELFALRRDRFLALILAMDDFKGTHRMFRLGNWTQMARDAAGEIQGATTATPDWYELQNARTLITTWGDENACNNGGLRDYSYRSWQGLLRDYYYPRWDYYFRHDCSAPAAGWFYSEWNWAHELEGEWGASAKGQRMKEQRTFYSPVPVGNTARLGQRLVNDYLLPVNCSDAESRYAYRGLTNDFSDATIVVQCGQKLANPFADKRIAANLWIDGEPRKGRRLAASLAVGSHEAQWRLTDGTVVVFCLEVLPK